jgi:hypothetical protein
MVMECSCLNAPASDHAAEWLQLVVPSPGRSQTRADVDTPVGLSPASAVDTHSGQQAATPTQRCMTR